MVDGPAADLMPSPLPSPRPPQARDRAGGLKGKAVYPTISTWAMIAAASRRDASKEKTVAAQALLQDLRFAARFLLRRRGASALALAALACGIGATSAIWSVVDTVLLQPLPYRGEILVVRENIPGISDMVPLTAYELVELRAASRTLAGLAAADLVDFTLLADGAEPASVAGARVTPDFFALLGVRPAHGRTFVPQDAAPGAPPVAVVGYAFYAKRFGADPDLAGKSLRTQSATALGSAAAGSSDRFQIVGVLPPEFRSPFEDEEIWTPLAIDRAAADRVSHTLFVLGKARPGEALPQVRSELDTLLVHLEPGMALHQKAGRSVTVVPLAAMLVQNVRGGLLILFAAVSLVLLIVCANVANLLLAQALARQREMAQRAALGAGRPRLLGQMLVESLLLALAGGAAGLALAYALLRLLVAASPGNIPRLELVGIDLRVLAFTVAITLGCGLLFGLVPAWRTSRLRFHEVLKSGGRVGAERSHERLRGVLVIAQVALTVLVVVGALLLYRSFRDLQTLDYGFRSRGVLTATIDLPDARYPQPAQQEAFFRRLLERIKGLPGVRAAGMVNSLPLSRINTATTFDVVGRAPVAGNVPSANYRLVSADYLPALGVPLLAGRPFAEADVRGDQPRVALVDRALAERYWPGESPVGRRIALKGVDQPVTIAGVVGDVHHRNLDLDVHPTLYLPLLKSSAMSYVVRTGEDPLRLAAPLRQAVHELDREQPVDVATLDQIVADAIARPRFNALLLGLLAALALALALVGIYSVMHYSVTQRYQEIGVRMALGAPAASLLRQVHTRALALAAAGVACGMTAAWGLTRLLASQLYGVSPTDPWTFTAAAVLLPLVALLASHLPARRAIRIDPTVVLRKE